MKKFVCLACGLVNLDGFVSYPHCAACGARLPQQPPARWRAFWRRPVNTLYFALAVGGGLIMLALGVIRLARETREGVGKPLLVYSKIPRKLAPGQSDVALYTLDSAEEAPDAAFEAVQMRLSRDTLRDLSVIAIQPAPQTVAVRGSGRYYGWEELPRGTTVKLSFRPRVQSGVVRLHVTLSATDYVPFETRSTLRLTTAKLDKTR